MTEQEAIAWLAEILEESPESVTPDTPRDAIIAWDSIGSLNLMAEFDMRFEILLADEDFRAMETFGDLLDVLRKNGKLSD